MASTAHAQATYARYLAPADVAVVEGVMGLCDGADRMAGSAAAVAELLGILVILVVDARAMAYSVAPLLFGFKNFYPGIRLVGALFNFVNTAAHYEFLREACADVGVEALGYLPENPAFAIPSRHLGLSIDAENQYEAIAEALANALPATVDVGRLLTVTRTAAPAPGAPTPSAARAPKPRRIAVARDAAFIFTYRQNLAVLERFGEITYFSLLADAALPAGTDFLYLPGGYPELFAGALSANVAMRASIAAYCASGDPAYAECGGLMYLGNSIVNAAGLAFMMVGALPCTTSLTNAKMTLGYRIIEWNNLTIKGYEFHYSVLNDHGLTLTTARITSAKGAPVPAHLYCQGSVWAFYVHLYWGENPAFIERLLGIEGGNGAETGA